LHTGASLTSRATRSASALLACPRPFFRRESLIAHLCLPRPSLQFDRLQKRPQYAAAGIPEYWIVNLIDRRLEVFRDPAPCGDYQVTKNIAADGVVELIIDGRPVASIAVADLLP
jgi:Putative restriction endonuclease